MFEEFFKTLDFGGMCVRGFVVLITCIPTFGIFLLWVFGDIDKEIFGCSAIYPGNLWNLLAEVSENCLAFQFYIALASDFSMLFYVVTAEFFCAVIQA